MVSSGDSQCRFQTVAEILRGHFSRLGWQLLQKIKPTYPHQCCLSCPMNQLEPPEAGLPEKRWWQISMIEDPCTLFTRPRRLSFPVALWGTFFEQKPERGPKSWEHSSQRCDHKHATSNTVAMVRAPGVFWNHDMMPLIWTRRIHP